MKLGELRQFILNTEDFINKKRHTFQKAYNARYSAPNIEKKITSVLSKVYNNNKLTLFYTKRKLKPFLFKYPNQIIYSNDLNLIIGMNVSNERRTYQYYTKSKRRFSNTNTLRRLKVKHIRNNILQQVVSSCVNENSHVTEITGRAVTKSDDLLAYYNSLNERGKILNHNFRISYPLKTLDFYGEGIPYKHIKHILVPLLSIYKFINYNIEFTICNSHNILFGRWIRVRSEFFTMWFKPRRFKKLIDKSIRSYAKNRIRRNKNKIFEELYNSE